MGIQPSASLSIDDFEVKPLRRFFEFTEDWVHFFIRDGLSSCLPLIISDLVRLPYRRLRFVVFAHSLLDPLPSFQPKVQLTIRPFEPADLDLVRQIDRPSEARLCARRLSAGHRGLVAFYAEQPVGYAWGSTDTETLLERVHPRLDPGDVLLTDAYTAPAFRCLGVQSALTWSRFQMFRELGCCRAICYIETRNKPSLAVWQRKYHSQVVGSIDFTRVGPWYKIRYSGQ